MSIVTSATKCGLIAAVTLRAFPTVAAEGGQAPASRGCGLSLLDTGWMRPTRGAPASAQGRETRLCGKRRVTGACESNHVLRCWGGGW